MSIRIDKVFAGSYWSDGGAFMGVLPYSIWGKFVELDERRRKSLSLNLVLIRTGQRCILVDT
ncbi:MAG: hypothetical protein U1B83_09840, partial [Candidatus Cloacimonadaceae bacterium]|nr:hypothetical protein [Candidatus Cloacimonadaceae bacterium]